MMDDAWERTDTRTWFIRSAKRTIHRSIDGVFVPAESHAGYFRSLGFPDDRIVFGVDVVDNDYFAECAGLARVAMARTRAARDLPADYFLFVGRLLPRKGLTTLLDAYGAYRRATTGRTWSLVLVGSGPDEAELRRRTAGDRDVHVVGRKSGRELADYYGLAGALVVPSAWDPWALVVNEGMASGLPVIVSRGCGCASELVEEGANGWTFESGDARRLAEILGTASRMSADLLAQMGSRSSEIIAGWSLDRYVAGVVDALSIPRRVRPDPLSRIAARLWKGRISVK
jgi:glycosyltransferase involved in cell wall biosynthesis